MSKQKSLAFCTLPRNKRFGTKRLFLNGTRTTACMGFDILTCGIYQWLVVKKTFVAVLPTSSNHGLSKHEAQSLYQVGHRIPRVVVSLFCSPGSYLQRKADQIGKWHFKREIGEALEIRPGVPSITGQKVSHGNCYGNRIGNNCHRSFLLIHSIIFHLL
jgi:hypothetical protein